MLKIIPLVIKSNDPEREKINHITNTVTRVYYFVIVNMYIFIVIVFL